MNPTAFSIEGTNDQYSCCRTLCRLHQLSAWYLVPEPLLLNTPMWAPIASPGLCGCIRAKCQCKFQELTPLLCTCLELALPAVHLHGAGLTLFTSLHCTSTPGRRAHSHKRAHLTARTPQVFVGMNQALSTITGLHHCAHLQLVPPVEHLHFYRPNHITGFHCHVPKMRLNCHGSMCW